MKNTLIFGVLGALVVLLLLAGATYNTLVARDQATKTAWADVENQYQRRADLVPNLVSTVKGAAAFEQDTFTQVTEARAKATSITVDPTKLDAASVANFDASQGELTTALGKLLLVMENYPQLTATQAFRDLTAQLEGTENRISVARRDFNASVQAYNTTVLTFPTSIVASLLGFTQRAYFAAQDGAAQVPDVSF